eukprot:scaffold24055_cov113-Isochrysis_galbana.AAC.1
MFRLAGAQVATCDLLPSEIDYVPHFQGDCKHIQDQGWDLVIGHPPCTYLSAVGAGWLKSEPEREQAVRSAAKLFVSICESQAPFVAVENPKMHSLATDLVGGRKATQYVQPYEHGTGHQKATGLYLTYNLPLIQPTCIMAERTSAMADLPRSPHRGALRSRTYIGIAAAMALQWMPTLLGYCKIRTSPPKTVNEMLHAARLSLAATPSPELDPSESQTASRHRWADDTQTRIPFRLAGHFSQLPLNLPFILVLLWVLGVLRAARAATFNVRGINMKSSDQYTPPPRRSAGPN